VWSQLNNLQCEKKVELKEEEDDDDDEGTNEENSKLPSSLSSMYMYVRVCDAIGFDRKE
jgi:hypothetical protein